MKIKIAQRFHPFSHRPGIGCLLPKSPWQVQVFPTLLRFKNLMTSSTEESFDVHLHIQGPMENFTVEQDLEKGVVRVFGHTPLGFLRYVIFQHQEGIALYFDKNLKGGIDYDAPHNSHVAQKETIVILLPTIPWNTVPTERLSLGMHRSQDWDLITRRCDLRELLPIWFRLGQWTPTPMEMPSKKKGTLELLQHCYELVSKREKEAAEETLRHLFLTGFSPMMLPRLTDEDHLGILENSDLPPESSPLHLLTQGGDLIRSLFFHEKKGDFFFLPCLFPSFHAGRFTQIRSKDGDLIDLEWSKKLLRRVILNPAKDKQVVLHLQTALKTFRVRASLKDRGAILRSNAPLALREGKRVILDRFQK